MKDSHSLTKDSEPDDERARVMQEVLALAENHFVPEQFKKILYEVINELSKS